MVAGGAGLRSAGVFVALMALVGGALAQGPGVSHELAVSRATRVSGVRYGLQYALKEHAATIEGKETVRFSDEGGGDLAIDFRDGMLESASLNGRAIGTKIVEGHLMLPGSALVAGENRLEIAFAANVAAAGKAVTRYADKDDGNEYLYTLFVPMDSSMAFRVSISRI